MSVKRAVAILLAATAAGCAPPPPPASPPPQSKPIPPPSVAPSHGAPAPPADPLARAREIYASNCVTCHGVTGTGTSHFAEAGIPNFADAKWHARESDAELERVIRKGKGKFMPAWEGKLTDAEIAALIRFLRTFPDTSGTGTAEG
jgi:mono/diheme cytochrome c family protein